MCRRPPEKGNTIQSMVTQANIRNQVAEGTFPIKSPVRLGEKPLAKLAKTSVATAVSSQKAKLSTEDKSILEYVLRL